MNIKKQTGKDGMFESMHLEYKNRGTCKVTMHSRDEEVKVRNHGVNRNQITLSRLV